MPVARQAEALQCSQCTGDGHAGCTGAQAFSSVQLTTLGTDGPTGPAGGNGYITSACPDTAGQLVQSGALTVDSGVQRFTVPVTGTYRLDVNGEYTTLRLFTHRHSERWARSPGLRHCNPAQPCQSWSSL